MQNGYKGKYVGANFTKSDAYGHVTGNTKYQADKYISNMLYCKVLRHTINAGKLISLDTSEAKKIPGVVAIATADDIPGVNLAGPMFDEPAIKEDELRMAGEVIAAVAAVDEETAAYACTKIKYEVEEYEPVLDMWDALEDSARQVRPEGNLYTFDGHPYPPVRRIRTGENIEDVFEKSDLVVEEDYYTPPQEQAPLEPCVSTAYIDEFGVLNIMSCSQGPAWHIDQLAPLLGLTTNQVVVIGGTIGGGFGGRNDLITDHIAAIMALKTKRPVRYQFTRAEEMLNSTVRGAWRIRVKDGLMKDGTITGRKITLWHDNGGYSGQGYYAVDKGSLTIPGPYNMPSIHIDGHSIFTNKIVASAMRGFGINLGQFAVESQMDVDAKALGMDPLEFRFKNMWREGAITATGQETRAIAAIETLQKASEVAGVELPEHLASLSSFDKKEGEQ